MVRCTELIKIVASAEFNAACPRDQTAFKSGISAQNHTGHGVFLYGPEVGPEVSNTNSAVVFFHGGNGQVICHAVSSSRATILH